MTSAPNHLLPLNGSKLSLLLLFMALLMITSCSGPKPTSKNGRTTTEKTRKRSDRPKRTKVDTVKWAQVPTDKYNPIKSDFGPIVKKADLYHIAVLLPFKATEYTPSRSQDAEKHRFLQFYSGAKLALEKLKSERINIQCDVWDTEGSESVLKDKLNKLHKNTHVVIGPYDRELLRITAEHGLKKNFAVVSPWQASSRIANDNPFYIQLRPDLRDHYHKIVEDIVKKYHPGQVIVFNKYDKSDANRVEYIQEYAAKLLGVTDVKPFREYTVHEDSLSSPNVYMKGVFNEDKETVFLLNNYSFEDEEYIYNVIRKLSGSKGMRKASLYGMPILLETDRMDFNLYNIMNVKIAMSKFINVESTESKDFSRAFFEVYGAIPDDEAYYGYDVMLYFGRALHKYGIYFQHFIDQEDKRMLQGKFDIQKVLVEPVSDHFKNINYFMNRHLDIVEIRDNRFSVSGR